jgi:hypothetical protein
MTAVTPLTVLIVERSGNIKTLNIKDFKEEDLYKKCGFKSVENFRVHSTWNIKYDHKIYIFELYGKTKGKANNENKYDFPPPVDNTLFFGNCLMLCYVYEDSKKYMSLTIELWNKVYEKLFGGFEDLMSTVLEDENEEDELKNVPFYKKTKIGGYLKDGFVVDTADEDEEQEEIDEQVEGEEPTKLHIKKKKQKNVRSAPPEEEDELTEEEYI